MTPKQVCSVESTSERVFNPVTGTGRVEDNQASVPEHPVRDPGGDVTAGGIPRPWYGSLGS